MTSVFFFPFSSLTFRLFPVGDPNRADAVGLRGQVLEMDHHSFTGLGYDHGALNTCEQADVMV